MLRGGARFGSEHGLRSRLKLAFGWPCLSSGHLLCGLFLHGQIWWLLGWLYCVRLRPEIVSLVANTSIA